MAPWSVVTEGSRRIRRGVRFPRNLPRIALLVCLALVVVSLGMVLNPGRPREAPEPPLSERVRAAALADALLLRADAERLGAQPAAASEAAPEKTNRAAATRTVSLLTTQARALLPGGAAASPTAAPPGPPEASQSPSVSSPPPTAAGLSAALAGSGRQRLADAAAADGGMARLLAAVGTAQLLESSSLAAAAGVPDPAGAGADAAPVASPSTPATGATGAPGAPSGAPSCPAPEGPASSAPVPSNGTGARNADLPGALAALVRTEAEAVYGYQAALTRLGGAAATSAAEQLARHEALLAGAETQSRRHCAPIPPREAGYALDSGFLAAPGSGLAALEAASLPTYADLVALSDGDTRRWAISGLLGAARRAAQWGATSDALTGLAVDPVSLPALPAG